MCKLLVTLLYHTYPSRYIFLSCMTLRQEQGGTELRTLQLLNDDKALNKLSMNITFAWLVIKFFVALTLCQQTQITKELLMNK